jgi:hypothetical protein
MIHDVPLASTTVAGDAGGVKSEDLAAPPLDGVGDGHVVAV